MSGEWMKLGIRQRLAQQLEEEGLGEPTPVQREALPPLLAGRDVTARSGTGTGKTLAYLLPLLEKIDPARPVPQAVVISPTQELAMQIVRVAERYGKPLGIRALPLIGGASLSRQVERLKTHPQLVIGTPGRLYELVTIRKLKLHEVRAVVVDEADQVFALGSPKEVEALFGAMLRDRQIAFFSATLPGPMAEVERQWMNDPVRIDIDPKQRVAAGVDHWYVISDKRDKPDTVRRLLHALRPSSALLFLNNTNEIANWEAKLRFEGFTVETLYGDADKQKRAATLERFRSGRCRLLLATDVAARGLDIEGLPLVVQIDPALDADRYIHRAGRTGRMGKPGTVVTVITPQERFIMDKFGKQLGIGLEERVIYKGRLWKPNDPEVRGSRRGGAAGEARGGAVRKLAGEARGGAVGPKPAGNARAGTVPKSAAPSKAKEKQKRDRDRDRKDKGAPRWLKSKRQGES